MKTFKLSFSANGIWICLLLTLFSCYEITAQVSAYAFSTSTGASLNAMTSSSVLVASNSDDVSSSATNIGFTFNFNCTNYTQFSASSNGLMGLGSSAVNSSYINGIASSTTYPIIIPMWDDMHTGSNGKVHYVLTGSSPNRILTVEWLFRNLGESGNYTKQVQVNLYETSNIIEIIYGTGPGTNPVSASIGIASSTTDFQSITTSANTVSTASANDANTTFPASGRKYTFTPGSMAFVSSTVVQSSSAATTRCDLDQDVVCLQIVTSGGCLSPLSLTSLQLGAGGSTSGTLADVSTIHVYYTGTTNTFNTTNEFVSGGTIPGGGTNTLLGSQTLSTGTNYFWIAYDVNPAATITNVIDASVTQFTVAAVNRIPTATNPAGTRAIGACSLYPITVALGLKHWVKSDAGVTGSPVSAWADQSAGAVTGNMAQATASLQPLFVSNAVNFQPYLRFDGSNDILVSANTFTGNSLFNANTNTILMVKNLKSGSVDYKWENSPTGASRFGFELNGSTQRFDFVNDVGGKNVSSATSMTNKDVIVGVTTDATNNNIRINGNTDGVNSHGGLSFSPGASLKPLNLGANDLGNPLYCQVDLAEVMTFNVKLGSSELRRVESYLAIKYGITLQNNKGASASVTYMAGDGAQIWANQTGYHNNVIGIGRDNAAANSGLNKVRSKSVLSLNSSLDILTIANGTNMGGTAFGSDKSFFITGNNAQALNASAASNADLPATIQSRLTRVWKGQETGTVGTISLKFDLATVTGTASVAGNNNLADIRLLVDADGVFAAGATIVTTPSTNYTNATSDTIVFQFDFTGATGFYYTLGSVNIGTAPLPISLIKFTAECQPDGIHLNWATATELNNHYFELQRSEDGMSYSTIATIQGHGTSLNQNNYFYKDVLETDKINYYRLKQVDYDNQFTYYNFVESVENNCQEKNNVIGIYPNPASGNSIQLKYKVQQDEEITIKFYDVLGRTWSNQTIQLQKENYESQLDISNLAKGLYFIKIESTQLKENTLKFIKE